jgi:hypothetical protein
MKRNALRNSNVLFYTRSTFTNHQAEAINHMDVEI